MIVAAGLGTRMRPLSDLRPKPAMPVRGLPLIAYNLALLARAGVTEVAINLHAQPAVLERAARRHCPSEITLRFSVEERLLDTGGGIRRLASFLRESDPSLILGGDMILEADLTSLLDNHREQRDAVTMLLLRNCPRVADFGTIGVDGEGCVRRIGQRFDLGGESDCGVYTWANVVASRAFDSLPDREAFGHLDDWWAPLLRDGARDIRGVVVGPEACSWQPVGTPAEYLRANFEPEPLSYLDADAVALAAGTRFEDDVVIGAGATLGAGASLKRCVVWDGEQVPAGLNARDGVFAGGALHRFRLDAAVE